MPQLPQVLGAGIFRKPHFGGSETSAHETSSAAPTWDHVLKSYPFLTWSTCTKVLSENDLELPQARNATDHSDWLKTSLAFPHSGKNGCGQSGSQPRIRCPEHHNFLSRFQLLQKPFSSPEEQLPSTSPSSMDRVRGTFLQTLRDDCGPGHMSTGACPQPMRRRRGQVTDYFIAYPWHNLAEIFQTMVRQGPTCRPPHNHISLGQ